MTNVDFDTIAPFIKLGSILVFLALIIGFFILGTCALFDMLDTRLQKKQQLKRYLQEHRFDRFRVAPFVDDRWIVGEYIGVDTIPLVVAYCNDLQNAQHICDILNMDFLGEIYLEKRFKKISTTVNRADINNLKDPQKEGERTDEKC